MSAKAITMNTIHEVLKYGTADLVKDALTYICGFYERAYLSGDHFVYARGTSPICIVAHMDTVRDPQIDTTAKYQRHASNIGKPYNLVQNRNVLTNATGILGGDDRAGVFGCFEIIRRCKKAGLPLPSILLTNGEESGGKGVGVFVSCETFKKHDNGLTRLFVEMDRQGCNEWVTYGATLPKEVIAYVESFGFVKGNGSYSDIADLQEEYGIPSVNLSIGYYAQHSDKERLHIDEMYTTINRVFNMVKDPIDQLYKVGKKVSYVYTPTVYHGQNLRNYREDWPEVYNPDKFAHNRTGATTPAKVIPLNKPEAEQPSLWIDKTGNAVIDKALDDVTQGGFCRDCGFPWEDCDESCGTMVINLGLRLTNKELALLADVYVNKDSVVRAQIETYLADSALLAAAEKDPHHVDADGTSLIAQ